MAPHSPARLEARQQPSQRQGAMAVPAGRRQSTRQVRTSAARPHNYYSRTFSLQSTDAAPPANVQPGFFPAVSHFTDSVDALPREVMRHFSMLKEVEAKLHAPDEELSRLADSISRLSRSLRGTKTMQDVASPSMALDRASERESNESDRLRLYKQLNYGIAVIAPMLDEKIAVLSTANMTLSRQLERMESSYSHIPEEISDEARLGSTTHWAFTAEKESKKPTGPHERSRREAATNSVAAAAAVAAAGNYGDGDVAASRSEAKREAMQARKIRNQHVDSDFEDRPVPRKPHGKGRRPADPGNAQDSKSLGLGVANGAPGPTKRRKNAAGSAAMERSHSGLVTVHNRSALSPRETPAAEVGKKRKNAAGPGPGKRMHTASVSSPRLASSPILGPAVVKERLGHGRGRQNSQNGIIQNPVVEKNRPSSSASNRPAQVINGSTAAIDKSQPTPSTTNAQPTIVVGASGDGNDEQMAKADSSINQAKMQNDTSATLKREEVDNTEDITMAESDPIVPTLVTTRAGRVSKTATPIIGAFPEAVLPGRGRTARNKDAVAGSGSHASSESGYGGGAQGERVGIREKRRRNGASKDLTASARKAKIVNAAAEQSENDDEADGEEGEEGDVDGEEGEENEPRYCYCNGVSYGEMVACDNENCTREWFHLKCAGLKEAPGIDSKWFCDECKLTMKESRRSRPK